MKPRDSTTPSGVMTLAELAAYLRIHPSTIYKMLRKGEIPGFKIGSDHRFNRSEIDKWMARRTLKSNG